MLNKRKERPASGLEQNLAKEELRSSKIGSQKDVVQLTLFPSKRKVSHTRRVVWENNEMINIMVTSKAEVKQFFTSIGKQRPRGAITS